MTKQTRCFLSIIWCSRFYRAERKCSTVILSIWKSSWTLNNLVSIFSLSLFATFFIRTFIHIGPDLHHFFSAPSHSTEHKIPLGRNNQNEILTWAPPPHVSLLLESSLRCRNDKCRFGIEFTFIEIGIDARKCECSMCQLISLKWKAYAVRTAKR